MIVNGLAIGIPVLLAIAGGTAVWAYLGRDTGTRGRPRSWLRDEWDGLGDWAPEEVPEVHHDEYHVIPDEDVTFAPDGPPNGLDTWDWDTSEDVPGREPPGPATTGDSAPALASGARAARPAGDHPPTNVPGRDLSLRMDAHPAGDHCPKCGQPVTECPAERLWGHRHATGCTGILHGPGAHLCNTPPDSGAVTHASAGAPQAAPEPPGPDAPSRPPGPGDLAHDIEITAALARSIAGTIRGLEPGEYRELIEGEGMTYTDQLPLDSWERGDSLAMDLSELHQALKDGA